MTMVMTALCAIAMNAQVRDNSLWTDGMVMYGATWAGGGTVVMEGGTLHEGGYKFVLKKAASGGYTVHPGLAGEDYISMGAGCVAGDKVKYETIQGLGVLTCYHGGKPVAVLHELKCRLDDFMKQSRYDAFAGNYVDMNTGEKWMFTVEGRYSKNGGNVAPYTVLKEYDMPSNVILLADGTTLLVELTAEGLNLRACKVTGLDDDMVDEVHPGAVVAMLNRISSGYANGKWSIATHRLLNPEMLGGYSKETLRLMRNEIFARKGQKFNSADLKAYFAKQPWYKPSSTGTASLTPLETKNVEIIKIVEESNN